MPSARESAEANKSNNHRYAKQHDDPTRTKYVVVVVYKKKGKWGVRAIDIGPSPSIKWKVSKLEHGDGLCGGKKKQQNKQVNRMGGEQRNHAVGHWFWVELLIYRKNGFDPFIMGRPLLTSCPLFLFIYCFLSSFYGNGLIDYFCCVSYGSSVGPDRKRGDGKCREVTNKLM